MTYAVTGGQQGFSAMIVLQGAVDTPTTVHLQSTDGVLQVPSSVVIPAGTNFATFSGTTSAVTSVTYVNVIATLGTTSITSPTITIYP